METEMETDTPPVEVTPPVENSEPAAEQTAEASSADPEENPEEIIKNDTKLLKDAKEQMSCLDVLVCGQCHSAFHFVEEFKEHKEGDMCTGKSPLRDSSENKAQVWAFLLWKCSSARDANTTNENSWMLYQDWCRMPMAKRNSWITAGTNVQTLSKYADAKLSEKLQDQMVPVQTEAKKRGRPAKRIKEDSETQPSGEENEEVVKPKPKTPLQKAKELIERESVRNAQERVPPEERIARRTEEGTDPSEAGEYVVEKILAKRFNPRRKQYEYLLKWEGYPHEQNTWEPLDNMETCKSLMEAFEKQLARQKELKALKAQQEQQDKVKNVATPNIIKKVIKNASPQLTPSGRPQRTSKARAYDQVKAWCGAGAADDEPVNKKIKRESSDDDDFSADIPIRQKKPLNGDSPKKPIDPELVKSLGLSGKNMPNIKGVIKVDPKHMPNLSTGVYIMSKSSGIMKIDSPGKLGPGLNIDQEVIRKQILAAKQKKGEEIKRITPAKPPVTQPRPFSGRQQVTEKTIITPSGQKIIQRTIQRPSPADGKSPVQLLNRKLAQSESNSLLRRGVGTPRGRGRGGYVSTASGNIVRLRDKVAAPLDTSQWEDEASDSSDGITDPFPTDLGPLPEPSPDRELTLCPDTGKRLARAEGEPTPPPTPSPPPTPPPVTPPPQPHLMMKVEMSPGGTTGMLIQGEGAQPSLPMLTDEDGTEVKVEASVKQLLESGVNVEEGEEVNLLQGHAPIMIRGEDGVLYQVAGENEEGQTLLVAAEDVGVAGENEAGQTLLVAAEGVEGGVEGVEAGSDGEGVMYVTREDGQEMLAIEPSQLAQLMPGGEVVTGLAQVAVQVEGEGDESTQVIAQLMQADLPSPGGTRRVVLLLPDGSLTMTELDKEQYESITEGKSIPE